MLGILFSSCGLDHCSHASRSIFVVISLSLNRNDPLMTHFIGWKKKRRMSVHHVSLFHTRIFTHCFNNSDNCFFICRSCGTAGAGEHDLVRGYRLATMPKPWQQCLITISASRREGVHCHRFKLKDFKHLDLIDNMRRPLFERDQKRLAL